MAKKKDIEAFRAGMQAAAAADSDTAIHYYLKSVAMREGEASRRRLYAQFCPVRRISQDDLCRNLEAHNRKYTAGEYKMILDDILDEIAYQLRSGNCVSLPDLGLFSLGIGGAYDPSDRTSFRKHPVRATLRIASAFHDKINDGAQLKRLDALPVCARLSGIAYSEAPEEGMTYYKNDSVPNEVHSEASAIHIAGEFRNLPDDMTATLQQLAPDTHIPVGNFAEVPLRPSTAPSRQSENVSLVTLDTSSLSPCLLPGTAWRITVHTGSEDPDTLDFAIATLKKRK